MRSNLPLLERIARKIEPLLHEVVFVGGATTELFFTSPAAVRVRMTQDADVICDVLGRVE
jgi:predicted RNA-binding protein with PUA domain